jgi:hypothetical protein
VEFCEKLKMCKMGKNWEFWGKFEKFWKICQNSPKSCFPAFIIKTGKNNPK